MNTSVAVCIPWREQKGRIPAFRTVYSFWKNTGYPIYLADSNSKVFSIAEARNNAVKAAHDADIIITCDADTIPPMMNVQQAIARPEGFTWTHSNWRLIPAEYAHKNIRLYNRAPVLQEVKYGLGGAMVCKRAEYWRIGGQPAEVQGWGYEDTIFELVARTLSSVRRLNGIAYSLEHHTDEDDRESPELTRDITRNKDILEKYRRWCAKPWMIRQEIKRRQESGECIIL